MFLIMKLSHLGDQLAQAVHYRAEDAGLIPGSHTGQVTHQVTHQVSSDKMPTPCSS